MGEKERRGGKEREFSSGNTCDSTHTEKPVLPQKYEELLSSVSCHVFLTLAYLDLEGSTAYLPR